jgi:LytS/YehU family sensor histidine kinase
MLREVKKLYNNLVEVRDYDVQNAITRNENLVIIQGLKPASYIIQIRSLSNQDEIKQIPILIKPAWYNSWKAYVLYFFCFFIIGWVLAKKYFNIKQKKLKSELSLLESELKALRAQINPHYLSNSLISLQNSILEGNHDKSLQFISMFNRVMRNILLNSEKNMTSIEGELKIIKDYIALENISREQMVQLLVEIDNPTNFALEDMLIPTNIIQPIVENAFIHGFSEKLNRELNIHINIVISHVNLKIEIIDNGKGFYPSNKGNNSFGLKNIKLVIQKLQLKYKKNTNFNIVNRTDESGTQVTILLPIITQSND